MIYLTGDIHGTHSIRRLGSAHWPEGRELTRDDYLIVLGDFGLVWDGCAEDEWWLEWLDERPWTTLFIDGNHENHRLLAEYPEREWHGGMVHEIRPHVLHLIRGHVFDVDGTKLLAMGGADSHDKEYRTEGETWWPEEVPSESERSRCLGSLDAHDWRVDCVLTHDAPAFALPSLSDVVARDMRPTEYELWLDSMAERLDYGLWCCGHFHVNAVHERRRLIVLYGYIMSLEELREIL